MITVLSTDTLDPTHQFAGFQKAICSAVVDLSAHRMADGAYRASIRRNTVGCLEYSFVDCDSVVIERSEKNIGRDKADDFIVAIQLEGSGHTVQLGREAHLAVGDYSIVDSTLPYSLCLNGPVRRLVVRVPRQEFIRRGSVPDNICSLPYRGSSGTSGLASRFLSMLGQDADGLDPALGHSLASTALDLLAAAESEDAPVGRALLNRSQAAILRRIRAIVIANLTDPDLSTDRVAELAGISVRYLHKIFSSTGMTLHQWIQDERLKRCYQSLTSPNQCHRTIQDIAFSNGFNDSGYFSHRFSRKYGVSPRSVRNQG